MSKSAILVINCGSSSIKYAVIDVQEDKTLLQGLAENLQSDHPELSWEIANKKHKQELNASDYRSTLTTISQQLQKELSRIDIIAVGHRVVHGGVHFKDATLINDEVILSIKQCEVLAPLHNPANLEGIQAARQLYPEIPHVAVFDTAFHQTLPEHAYLYPLPYVLYQEHQVRRYGFHGTSHHYVTQVAAHRLGLNYQSASFISAHLGNGCSACCVVNGKSVDTTMGMTPLEGLMMGTRSGDIDPGIPAYLAKQLGYDIATIDTLLNKKSGLLGVSGLSMDMRELSQASEKGNQQAQTAIALFCYRLAKHIASLMVPLERLDALIFTGGIGENAVNIRSKVLAQLKFFGFIEDENANQEHGQHNHGIISQNNSPCAMVINTDEQLAIAKLSFGVVEH